MHIPKLEFRIPVSPRDSDFRMVRYFLESIQLFGGSVAKSAHTVLSVGADIEPFNIAEYYSWLNDYSLDIRWVDRQAFRKWKFEATGFDRLERGSSADIVALVDADLLVTGDFDDVIWKAHREQILLGFMAHMSPFCTGEKRTIPSNLQWQDVFEAGGVEAPPLEFEYSGWSLNWPEIFPQLGVKQSDPIHRYGPAYFNYGVIIAPRVFVERMGDSFVDDLERVSSVSSNVFISQVTNCVTFVRQDIPCATLPVNYNFPLNLPSEEMRAINRDPTGGNEDADTKIFHYIGGRKHFKNIEAIDTLIDSSPRDNAWNVFQDRLRIVREHLGDDSEVRLPCKV